MTSVAEHKGFPVQSGTPADSADSGTDTATSGHPAASDDLERSLDEALVETFPASDPIAITSARENDHPATPA
jgi:hypothetical protein